MKSKLAAARLGYNRRDVLRLGLAAGVLSASGALLGAQRIARADQGGRSPDATCALIEPTAGTWTPWLFSSVSGLRAAPPPGGAMTQDELRRREPLAAQRQALLDRIRFWDAGAVYRWAGIAVDMMGRLGFGVNPVTKQPLVGLTIGRNMALVFTAIYDATIATWDSKYAYKRLRPPQIDPRLSIAVPQPNSPSYPREPTALPGPPTTPPPYLYPPHSPSLASPLPATPPP